LKKLIPYLLWSGRLLLEAAEIAVRARRALDAVLGNTPWVRPPWSGGGSFWSRNSNQGG